jgi:hypothetical protein
MDPDEFAGMFAGVDMLQAEAIGKVMGHVYGAMMQGMIDAGLEERNARLIMADIHRVFFHELMRMPRSGTGSE